jgi:hypothetical protein
VVKCGRLFFFNAARNFILLATVYTLPPSPNLAIVCWCPRMQLLMSFKTGIFLALICMTDIYNILLHVV